MSFNRRLAIFRLREALVVPLTLRELQDGPLRELTTREAERLLEDLTRKGEVAHDERPWSERGMVRYRLVNREN